MQPTTLKVTELMFVKKICPANYKLLSVIPGMETGSADLINGRLTSSIQELKYQTICNQIMMESGTTAMLAQGPVNRQ